MEKCWLAAVVVGFTLASGCTEDARPTPWGDPPGDDGVAGTSGDVVAGTGGTAGVGYVGAAGVGGSESGAPIEECDPGKPVPDMPDSGISMADADAGSIQLPPLSNSDDAGVEPEPEPVSPEHTADSGVIVPSSPRGPGVHGEVVVTELMFDPTALTDALGEWIELHNTTDTDLDLTACVVSDDRSDDFAIAPLLLPAGGYVVLGRSAEAATTVDQIYSGMVLANTTDEVVVTCSDVMIDRVAYGTGFPRRAGKTMQLNTYALDAVSNDDATSWCASTDAGTPGQANVACVSE